MVKVRDDLPKTQDGSVDIEKWVERVGSHYSDEHKELLKRAAYINLENGGHHLTPVNESCLKQGLLTAEILTTLRPDIETLVACILYFVIDFGDLTLEKAKENFNEHVVALLEGMCKLSYHSAKAHANHSDLQRDNLRKMLLAVVEDVRVVLIKLAEKISALRAASQLDRSTKLTLALEARDIYAPLANRLGIGQIKWELEDFAFRYLEPIAYKNIAKLLDEKRLDREIYIETVIAKINSSLKAENVQAEVVGRVKHIYSIWRKMIRKNLPFKEIYDVRAIRILVDNLHDCYAALGIVHGLWQYVPKEFDDYIATPKENGYQSLHTAVVGPEGKTVEIQIRTHKMHEEAELGVAAHWLYKEGKSHEPQYHTKINSLRNILEWTSEQEFESDAALQQELSEDRVYVFTPKGEIVDLPQNATPLDFAYHIHSDLGHRCRGAKINGVIKPLNYVLSSGEQVDVIAAKTGGPSRDWLNTELGYLNSARARSKVRSWFKQQDKQDNVAQGKESLERELKRLHLNVSEIKENLDKFKVKNMEELHAGIGRGDLRIGQILNVLQQQSLLKEKEEMPPVIRKPVSSSKKATEVTIQGVGNLLCHFAKCCNPVPGDPIVGYITIGRGVTIHRQDCLDVLEKQEQSHRLIQTDWGDITKELYSVDIAIEAYDRQGLLRDITSTLSNNKINVMSIHTKTNHENNVAVITLAIEIPDLDTLITILNKILQIPNVLEARRVGR